MASKSLYQKQADKRTKTALKLRARWDAKARKYATALMSALTGAADAKARLDRLNLLYGVDISTETLLVHALRTAGLGGSLSTALGKARRARRCSFSTPRPMATAARCWRWKRCLESWRPLPPPMGGGTPGPGPVAPVAHDVTLNGPDASDRGVTLAASAGDSLLFYSLGSGGSAPASMDISLGGAQVASVAYLDRYTGAPFSFIHNGMTRNGTFAATVNF